MRKNQLSHCRKSRKSIISTRIEEMNTLTLTKEKILEELKKCYDPEIPINVVDLGLIYDVQVDGDAVRVKMTLTARGCPMAGFISENVKKKLEELEEVRKAEVEVVWDPPWSPERLSPEAKRTLGL